MSEVLKYPINPLSVSAEFKISTLLPSEEKVRWLPIMPCGRRPDFYIGILESGDWVAEVREGLRSLHEPGSYLYAMALLEQSVVTIREKLEQSPNVNEIFPFVEIIRAGLEQKSEYWAGLAFAWFDEISWERKKELYESIAEITCAKWASQRLRQKAKKELRGLKQMAIPAQYLVLAVVRRRNKFLLILEQKPKNGWYLPAGKVKPDEDFIEAVRRETLEEAGIPIEVDGIVRFECLPDNAGMRLIFSARPADDTPPKSEPDEHSLKAGWFTVDEIEKLTLRGPDVLKIFSYVTSSGFVAPLSILAREGDPFD